MKQKETSHMNGANFTNLSINRLFAYGIRALGAAGSLALVFVLAKSTSAEFVGEFQYALTLALGLGILARGGLDRSLVRWVAHAHSRSVAFRLLRFSITTTVRRSAVIVLALAFLLSVTDNLINIDPWAYGVVLCFPFIAISATFGGYFKGSFLPTIGFLYDYGVIALLAALIIAFFAVATPVPMEVSVPMALATAYLFVSGAGVYWNRGELSCARAMSNNNARVLTVKSRNFFWMTGVVFLQQLILVSVLSEVIGNRELGIYKVSEKIALSVGFFQSVVAAIYAPHFARNFRLGNYEKLFISVDQSVLVGILLAFIPALFIIVFGREILEYFGEEYARGYPVAVILVMAQVINIVVGPAGLLLNMTGHERLSRNVLVTCSILSIPVIVFLAATFGEIGAAAALLSITIIQNLILYIGVKMRLGYLIFPKLSALWK